jgi:tRNA threonylcarbamoyladenosine biosynthesis protein TsaE
MTTVTTRSPDETRAVAAAFATVLLPGDVVLLCGELGAGKTTFVQGVGDALGVGEPMTSPTFTLVQTYGTFPVVAHADAWRLTNLREVLDLGLDELLDDGAVALVEWGDAVSAAIGRPAFVVSLERPGDDDQERTVTVEVTDEALARRLAQLDRALSPADRSWSRS